MRAQLTHDISAIASFLFATLQTSTATKNNVIDKLHQPEQTDRQADRQTDRQTGRQTDRQTGRQTDRQTGRQTGRQAGLVHYQMSNGRLNDIINVTDKKVIEIWQNLRVANSFSRDARTSTDVH